MAANPSSSSTQSRTGNIDMKDSDTLVAALSNLMPLLLRIQAEANRPDAFGLSRPNPALDQVAAVILLEDVCTDRLGRLSSYLEKHSQRFPALEACSAHVAQATFALNNRDYGQSLGLIWETYRLITTLGAINADLPPLSLLAERMQGAEQARH